VMRRKMVTPKPTATAFVQVNSVFAGRLSIRVAGSSVGLTGRIIADV
jgi:hypothetical protein